MTNNTDEYCPRCESVVVPIMALKCLLLLFIVMPVAGHQRQILESIYVPNLPEEQYIQLGDFNLGVLIPVHVRGSTSFCGTSVRGLGLLQRLEALVFAIEEINNMSSILPNHSLGYVVFDDCYTDLTALAQSLHFARTTPPETCKYNSVQSSSTQPMEECHNPLRLYDIIGMIGSESSITTLQAAKLMTAFQIPQISYLSTTPVLSNSEKYPLFQRVVPSDLTQARVILQLLAKFNWTFIYVMYSEGPYGEGIYRSMERIIREGSLDRSICFAEPIVIRQDFKPRDYDTSVWNMLFEKAANVTLIIAPDFEAQQIMAASKRMLVQGRLTWIAADAWARNINSLGDMVDEAYGMISINIHSTPVPRFDDYFQQISGLTAMNNPWVDIFWEQFFNCSRNEDHSLAPCNGFRFEEHSTYIPESTTSLVFDAVKTYAMALDRRIKFNCKGLLGEELVTCVRTNFSRDLRDVVFEGEGGDLVSFDENGDRMTTYDIYNVQSVSHNRLGYELVRIGEWNQFSQSLEVDVRRVQWALGVQPVSNCSRPCGVGEGMELQQKRCCWACVACLDNQYTRVTYGDVKRCYPCPENKWPDQETRTECLEIVPHYIDWQESMGVALIAMASFGISLSVVVITMYIVNNNHQLIKASSRELCYFMMAGILASYGIVFTLVVKPEDTMCIVSQLGLVIAFTVIYAPLCVKTIRIWRIFEAGRKMNRKPKCVRWSSQLVISLLIVFIHAVFIVTWSVFDTPQPDFINTGPGQVDLICRFPTGPFITSMSMNLILLIICSIFAFKTRKLPHNFNESRFISFCAFATVILWLAMIPSYFLTASIYRALFLALMLCTNGFILNGGLFIPKIYAIYFVEKQELHLQMGIFGRGRMSTTERSQISHIGHFIQDIEGSAIASSSPKTCIKTFLVYDDSKPGPLPEVQKYAQAPESAAKVTPSGVEKEKTNVSAKQTPLKPHTGSKNTSSKQKTNTQTTITSPKKTNTPAVLIGPQKKARVAPASAKRRVGVSSLVKTPRPQTSQQNK